MNLKNENFLHISSIKQNLYDKNVAQKLTKGPISCFRVKSVVLE